MASLKSLLQSLLNRFWSKSEKEELLNLGVLDFSEAISLASNKSFSDTGISYIPPRNGYIVARISFDSTTEFANYFGFYVDGDFIKGLQGGLLYKTGQSGNWVLGAPACKGVNIVLKASSVLGAKVLTMYFVPYV